MSREIVLITGATGHIGFRTLILLLSTPNNYHARIAIRSEAKRQLLLNNSTFQSLNLPSTSYSFILIPDITIPSAYTSAIRGVHYVIHIASPIQTGGALKPSEYETYFIHPAINATLNILSAARTEPLVKRVILTSSIAAIVPSSTIDDPRIYTAENRLPSPPAPYETEDQAYDAGKIRALNDAEGWMRAHTPTFDLVTLHPPYVLGRDDLVTTSADALRGTNAVVLRPALGLPMRRLPGYAAHLEDVARMHVQSLESGIPAGSYLAQAGGLGGVRWEEINAVVEGVFGDAVKEGVLLNSSSCGTVGSCLDARRTEEVFGWKFQSFQSMVESVVAHYLELVEGERRRESKV